MDELRADVKGVLLGDPRLREIVSAGGVQFVVNKAFLERFRNVPFIGLVDGGVSNRNLSGGVVERTMLLNIHVIHRIQEREEVIQGAVGEDGLDKHLNAVRKVLNNNRISGKYLRVACRSDLLPEPLSTEDLFVLEKGLTFEYVRVELP
jgi:hypothetical protein